LRSKRGINMVQKVPFFVVTHNRLSGLENLISFLKRQEMQVDLIIADMESTYKPMTRKLTQIHEEGIDGLNTEVWFLPNLGPRALYFSDFFEIKVGDGGFFLTDGDLDYSATSNLALSKLQSVGLKYPGFAKAGSALEIDNLPKNSKTDAIIAGEKRNYQKNREIEKNVFLAPVDTTLAYYPRYSQLFFFWPAVRVSGGSTVIHSPWSEDDDNLNSEEKFYLENQRTDISTVGGRTSTSLNSEKVQKVEIALFIFKPIIKFFPVICSKIIGLAIYKLNPNSFLKE
jgi:hypothetical protein